MLSVLNADITGIDFEFVSNNCYLNAIDIK